MKLVLALLLVCSTASAKTVAYTVVPGDTPESIAADYYGNRSLALIVSESNGLERSAKLKPGQKMRILSAVRYKVKRNETLEALAQRFCGDKRRAPQLAQIAGMKDTKLREGQEIIVPFNLTHRADTTETLGALARTYYSDPMKGKLLGDYNFRSSPFLNKGDRITVPIWNVKIRAVYLQAQAVPPAKDAVAREVPVPAVVAERDAQRREVQLAARVGGLLVEAEKSYRDGDYAEMAANLDKLLSEEDPSEGQLADIFKLKAFAYVALGEDDLASRAFREVLARKPTLVLDEATTSPKIRAALDRAKKAP